MITTKHLLPIRLLIISASILGILMLTPNVHAQTFINAYEKSGSDNNEYRTTLKKGDAHVLLDRILKEAQSRFDSNCRVKSVWNSKCKPRKYDDYNSVLPTESDNPLLGGYSISPRSGQSPLVVTAKLTSPNTCATYTIDWGDGTQSQGEDADSEEALICGRAYTNFSESHTYNDNGRYKVTIENNGSNYSQTIRVGDSNYMNSYNSPYFEKPSLRNTDSVIDSNKILEYKSLFGRITDRLKVLRSSNYIDSDN